MRSTRLLTLLALATAGVLWGTTVPLTKIALTGFGPGWLTVLRFLLAAAPLALLARHRLRAAASPRVLAWGAVGYGLVIVLQNLGVGRTSVTHASLIVGATPVLSALLGLATGRTRTAALTWTGLAMSLTGIGVIAAHGGGEATLTGDVLVFASTLLCSAFLLVQPGLLAGHGVAAVTAVQFGAGALAAVPFALLFDGVPASPGSSPMIATLLLAVAGTLVPFTVFAYGQKRSSAATAGAFLNLEPIVGFGVGVVLFGDALASSQVAGGLLALLGIALATAPTQEAPTKETPTKQTPTKEGEEPRRPVRRLAHAS